jgi:hypothetical protein
LERQRAGRLTARDRRLTQRLCHATIITGFDRLFSPVGHEKVAYVACSRGREDIELFVESIADLSQIQNRTGDCKAPVEMAFGNSQGDRAQVKELFRQLRRIRAVKAEPAERKRMVNLCRQAAQVLEPGRAGGQAADLQERAIRNAQEAARQAEAHKRHHMTSRKPRNASTAKAWSTAWACRCSELRT